MQYPAGLNPVRSFIMLLLGLAVGTFTFNMLASSPIIPKNFPTNKAIAATGLMYVVLDSIWASRLAKKEEQEYRKNLQASLEMLEDSQKKEEKR